MAENWTSLLEDHQRFKAPFFCKIRFYAPSRFQKVTERIQAQNAAHIGYIGMRPGVESIEEVAEDDPVKADPDTPAGHVRYLDERPRSHGLFSASGERPDLKSIQKELANHKGVVWRVVLSLTEEDAKRLDMTSRKNWETVLRATVPQAAAAMGIGETNLRWVAAFHQEKGHPHVHLVIWEKVPQRRRGKLSEAERKEVRKIFQNEIYAEERTRLLQEKTATRDLIRDLSKRELVNTVELIRGIREMQRELDLEFASMGFANTGIPPKLFSSDANEIALRLNQIGDMMPKRGRIAYQYMPPEVKKIVDETTKWLLRQPAFYETVSRYQAAVEGMTRQYTHREDQVAAAVDRAMRDLEKRVAQLVLKGASEAQKDVVLHVNPEKANAAVLAIQAAQERPRFPEWQTGQEAIKDTVSSMAVVLKAAGVNQEEIVRTIQAWNERSGAGIDRQTLERIAQQAIQRYQESETWGRPLVLSKKDFQRMCQTIGIRADYIWEKNGPGRRSELQQDTTALVAARRVWGSVWNALERERLRNIAQGEILKMQSVRAQQREREKDT